MTASFKRPDDAMPVTTSTQASLAAEVAPLGYMIVDLAAFIDGIESEAKSSLSDVTTLREAGHRIDSAVETVSTTIATLSETAQKTEAAALDRLDSISENSGRFGRMAEWGNDVTARLQALESVLKDVDKSNGDIARIARQVNILAVNASIEAARAGEAGRGFAIVAEAINELSRKTAQAAGGITESITSLNDWTSSMRSDAETLGTDFSTGMSGAEATRKAVEQIAREMTDARRQIDSVETTMRTLADDARRARPIYETIEAAAMRTAREVSEARAKSDKMLDSCGTLLQHSVELDASGPDSRFVAYVSSLRDRIATAMEAGVDAGQISMQDLFDFTYTPIPGSDPVQHEAPFSRFTDRAYQTIIEEALDFDPAVVFSAPCDRNGYIPTHNLKFSHSPGNDPAWNNGHCRNRRIFADRTGKRAGANTAPFLMQLYRRDMGSEGFVMMKDISVPIFIRNRHWGGLRMGYRDTSHKR